MMRSPVKACTNFEDTDRQTNTLTFSNKEIKFKEILRDRASHGAYHIDIIIFILTFALLYKRLA